MSELAILGGPQAVAVDSGDAFLVLQPVDLTEQVRRQSPKPRGDVNGPFVCHVLCALRFRESCCYSYRRIGGPA